jgi:hypothetical protein
MKGYFGPANEKLTERPNVTNGSVILGRNWSLPIKLERNFLTGLNREAGFKTVSNKKFSLLQ